MLEQHRGHWTLVEDVVIPHWNVEHVEREVQRMLDREKNVNVMMTQWASAAVSVAKILKMNHVSDIKIVRLEFTQQIKELMREGLVQIVTYASIEEGRQRTEAV